MKEHHKSFPCKTPVVRLDYMSYRQLRQRVLQRDGWKCQVCGSSQDLQVHHTLFRSHQGNDDEGNLITLRESKCHADTHRRLGIHEEMRSGSRFVGCSRE